MQILGRFEKSLELFYRKKLFTLLYYTLYYKRIEEEPQNDQLKDTCLYKTKLETPAHQVLKYLQDSQVKVH